MKSPDELKKLGYDNTGKPLDLMKDCGYEKPDHEDILSEIKIYQEQLGYNQQTLINMLGDLVKIFKEIKELMNEWREIKSNSKNGRSQEIC